MDWAPCPDKCGIYHRLSELEEMVSCQRFVHSPSLSLKLVTTQWIDCSHLPALTLFRPLLSRLDENLPVTFQGGLKGDAGGHHAYIFLRRKGQLESFNMMTLKSLFGRHGMNIKLGPSLPHCQMFPETLSSRMMRRVGLCFHMIWTSFAL